MNKKQMTSRDQILRILKTEGPLPITAISSRIAMTVEGARLHLMKLTGEGLVESSSKSAGPGRPMQIWSLTDAGHKTFPDSHAELTVRLINDIRETLGEEALERVIESNEQRDIARYKSEMVGCRDFESRIAKLAEIRSREGYMAEYQKTVRGYLLIENHCPVCAAANICQGFCRAEKNIFKAVLGNNVSIKRIEHIIKGARRCAYEIQEFPHNERVKIQEAKS